MANTYDISTILNSSIGLGNSLTTSGHSSVESGATAIGTIAGTLIGGRAGGLMGMAAGNVIGSIISSTLPTHTISAGSGNMNYYKVNRKPYGIKYVYPDALSLMQLNDYYCYWGCKTTKREILTIPSYMYQGHAYVKGDLELRTSQVPINYQTVIYNIFKQGVHFIQ